MGAETRIDRRPYEAPTVMTVDARQLLETLGPVCCYGPPVHTMPYVFPTSPPRPTEKRRA